ncbi:hypothetical protein NRI_0418 [Neorickettsia risticii str. Illinois]|uniref:Uncharacterized protein n=1 Tax=Neorickettsia risticii (strain Illinois) TaxID=434131 RepID=C6V4T5_NEORI|nr:hypothetical protein NRI_0418 [Neorickettsia risticii str. Illinois]
MRESPFLLYGKAPQKSNRHKHLQHKFTHLIPMGDTSS